MKKVYYCVPMLCMTMLFLLFIKDRQSPMETEVVEVMNKQNNAMLQSNDTTQSDFSILEIIPHEYCSVFPYLMGGKEEETPLKKDGLLTAASMMGTVQMFQNEETKDEGGMRPYSLIKNQFHKDNLNGELTSAYPTYASLVTTSNNDAESGKKWKLAQAKDKDDQDISYENASGYFEYVGKGGLYQIAPENVKYAYELKKGGAYGVGSIEKVVQSSKYSASGRHTNKDFNIYFTKASTNFEKIVSDSKAYEFRDGTDISRHQYKVASEYQNNDSGEYYKDATGYYVYDPKHLKQEAFYYDVTFEQTWWASQIYYIGGIELAKESEKGKYFLVADEIYKDVKSGNGIYDKYIMGISKIRSGAADIENQKWIWVDSPETADKHSTEEDFNRPQKGTKLYVTDMNFKKWEYVKDGYINNEWLKLFCLNWEEYQYDYSQTPVWNVSKARENGVLDDFDVDVIQRKPSEVTQADLEKADLIYISSTEGIEGLGNEAVWEQLTGRKETLPRTFQGSDFSDFSLANYIYQEYCERNKAVILNVNIAKAGLPHNSNLYKLYLMFNTFKNPDAFSFFFDELNRPSTEFEMGDTDLMGNFCRINSDGSVLLGDYASNSNMKNPIVTDTSLCSETTLARWDNWEERYFYPFKIIQEGENYRFDCNDSELMEPSIFVARHDVFNDLDEYTGKPFLNIQWYSVSMFRNQMKMKEIYLMLQYLGKPNITYPNAERVKEKDYVMYVDDFSDHIYVDFKVVSKRMNISKIKIYLEAVDANYQGQGNFILQKTIECNPSVKEYEQNHLKPLNGGNTELAFLRSPVGYMASGIATPLFPQKLQAGMSRKVRVEVSYSVPGAQEGSTDLVDIYKDISIKVRDSFDLN